MGATKTYFKQQFKRRMFGVNHATSSDFYLSCFQRNASPVPMLCIRLLLFLGCLGIVLSSLILSVKEIGGLWAIFLTTWGLWFITLASGFGLGVSVTVFFKGPIEDSFGLPWYIKVYWVLYSTTIPIAFFITVFYWSFLSNANEEFAVNFVLDVFIHAINSVLMFLLFITARQPTNVLHFFYPVVLAVIYVIFSVIYYFSGGTDIFGNNYIYPVLDWSNPGAAMVTVVFAAILILVLHFLIALLTVCRDSIARRFTKENDNLTLIG